MTERSEHPVIWLRHAGQRLGLVPSLGGGVAAWQLEGEGTPLGLPFDVWRAWDGRNPDRYSLASFAMLPWSNRISGGGFEHDGVFHSMTPNRVGEPYPIHGDGWLQPWTLTQPDQDTMVMTLVSRRFAGNPYDYEATQTFRLLPGGLDQTVSVTHKGATPLPYGLGLHPWFERNSLTRLRAGVQGVWLSGADPLPTVHTQKFPSTWDPRQGMDVNGTLIDNAYTGWCGEASITWPEHQLQLHMVVPEVQERASTDPGYCLLYRPPTGPTFCFEPVTHPIDAFHQSGRPGMQVLGAGECLCLHVEWRIKPLT
jgi:aldose 1-epimerase